MDFDKLVFALSIGVYVWASVTILAIVLKIIIPFWQGRKKKLKSKPAGGCKDSEWEDMTDEQKEVFQKMVKAHSVFVRNGELKRLRALSYEDLKEAEKDMEFKETVWIYGKSLLLYVPR